MSLRHWIWLSTIGLPPKSELALLDRFETPEKIYDASETDLKTVLSSGAVGAMLSHKSLGYADEVLENCAKQNVQVLTIRDAQYPDRLRNIDNPPIVLYVKGSLPAIDDEVTIAVVGTRKAPARALKSARTLAHDLSRGGAIIVSGMAEGIDGAAHWGALDAKCRTVAVFGCGIDYCYPAFHDKLMEEILKDGCIISEYAPGVRPSKTSFPARNRIISGLSLGTLVVCAPKGSGSLITANLALDQGRDVFVVPGNIDDANYEGANELLKNGATPVTEAGDILDTYSFRYPQLRPDNSKKTKSGYFTSLKRTLFGKGKETENVAALPVETKPDAGTVDAILAGLENDADRAIVSALAEGELHIDPLAEKTGLPVHTVLARMTMLEMEGIVTQKSGKYFTLCKK